MSNFSLIIIALYFITIISLIFGRYINTKLGNSLAIITSLITFIFASNRPDEFPDVDTYEIMFDLSSIGDFSNELYWLSHGEPGFKIISYFLYYLGADYDLFLLFMALLSYYLLLVISRLSKTPFSFLWFTYFSFYFITRDLGVLRLSIASHLIVIMLLKRKFISQIYTVAFASITFQYFSFLALAAPLLSRYKLTIYRVSFLIIISIFLSSFLSFDNLLNFIPEKQSISYDGIEMANPTLTPIIRNLLFAGFIFFLFKKQLKNPKLNSWVWASFLSVILYILTFNILIISQRMGAYFGAIIPIALAFKLNRTESSNFKFVLIAFICVLNFISVFYYNDFIWRIY